MKKTMFIIVLFAAALVLFTASTTNAIDGRIGHSAPRFQLKADSHDVFELGAMKGRWVLLDFWASTDAQSRISARRYSMMESTLSEKLGERQFSHVAINLDRNDMLYREIARLDGISAKSQFHADENRADRLIEQYHLDNEMNTYLIDPLGYVVAINPTVDTILAYASNDN